MIVYLRFLLFTLILMGCKHDVAALTLLPGESRAIATTYKVKADKHTVGVKCYQMNTTKRSPLTFIAQDQLVKIVAIEEGLRYFDGELWLRVYPPLTHRPNCYVNVDNLIPYS